MDATLYHTIAETPRRNSRLIEREVWWAEFLEFAIFGMTVASRGMRLAVGLALVDAAAKAPSADGSPPMPPKKRFTVRRA